MDLVLKPFGALERANPDYANRHQEHRPTLFIFHWTLPPEPKFWKQEKVFALRYLDSSLHRATIL
jgi:hypothetical protein